MPRKMRYRIPNEDLVSQLQRRKTHASRLITVFWQKLEQFRLLDYPGIHALRIKVSMLAHHRNGRPSLCDQTTVDVYG